MSDDRFTPDAALWPLLGMDERPYLRVPVPDDLIRETAKRRLMAEFQRDGDAQGIEFLAKKKPRSLYLGEPI